eukprot:gene6558-7235_t
MSAPATTTAATIQAIKKKTKWAEEEDEEDIQPVKPVGKSKVKEGKIRVPIRVKERRNLPRFGDAKIGEENVTIPSRDFVSMEHPDDQIAEDAEDPTLAKTLANFISKQAERNLQHNTETTLRVSNLTKLATEDDLRDLFGRFGRIYRIYLPRDIEKVPKGYAYIAFELRKDAEEAMRVLQGYGYDHLIIKIEWAKPMKEGAGGGGGGGGMNSSYVSGYGQKLAQDTTEKAIYHSGR